MQKISKIYNILNSKVDPKMYSSLFDGFSKIKAGEGASGLILVILI